HRAGCLAGMWGRWWRLRTSAALLPCPALPAPDGLGGRLGRSGLVRRLRARGCVQRWRAWFWCWGGDGRSFGLLRPVERVDVVVEEFDAELEIAVGVRGGGGIGYGVREFVTDRGQ